MYIKNMNFNQISDMLDDDNEVKIIYDIIVNAPDKDDEWVYNRLVEAEKLGITVEQLRKDMEAAGFHINE